MILSELQEYIEELIDVTPECADMRVILASDSEPLEPEHKFMIAKDGVMFLYDSYSEVELAGEDIAEIEQVIIL